MRPVTGKIWAGGSFELSRQTALATEGSVGKAGLNWNSRRDANITVYEYQRYRMEGGFVRVCQSDGAG